MSDEQNWYDEPETVVEETTEPVGPTQAETQAELETERQRNQILQQQIRDANREFNQVKPEPEKSTGQMTPEEFEARILQNQKFMLDQHTVKMQLAQAYPELTNPELAPHIEHEAQRVAAMAAQQGKQMTMKEAYEGAAKNLRSYFGGTATTTVNGGKNPTMTLDVRSGTPQGNPSADDDAARAKKIANMTTDEFRDYQYKVKNGLNT